MHIPEHMLNGNVCPVAAAVSAAALGISAYFASKAKNKPEPFYFSAVSVFIFALQMLNFPIQSGTSGHFLGAVSAALLLGVPFGVLSMALVLAVQCFLFADGGLLSLGANIFNMAVLGSGLCGFLAAKIISRYDSYTKKSAVVFVMSWLSVVLGASACSLELAAAGVNDFNKVFPAMASVHALIGTVEALATVAIYRLAVNKFTATERASFSWVGFTTLSIIAVLISPFASPLPDGLEWVAQKYNIIHSQMPLFISPAPDYSFSFVAFEPFSRISAAVMGMAVLFLSSLLAIKLLHKPNFN